MTERKSVSRLKRARILNRHGNVCYYCKTPLSVTGAFVVEHKRPLSRGGTNDEENLVPACYPCDRLKGSQTAEEFQSRYFDENGKLRSPHQVSAAVRKESKMTRQADREYIMGNRDDTEYIRWLRRNALL